MSALLLCRLITSATRKVLPSLFQICYTDSQVALFWIRGITKEWKPFVNHRVKEIREKVPPEFWRHCPGISNPADLPSRGMTPLELSVNQLWRRGPDWLQVGLTPTPQCELIDMQEPCAMEMKLASHSTVSVDSGATIEQLMDHTKYSSFHRLVTVTATVLRAAQYFKTHRRVEESNPTIGNSREQQDAELIWLRIAQRGISDQATVKKQFNLFQDENEIWCCGGRLGNAEVPNLSTVAIIRCLKRFVARRGLPTRFISDNGKTFKAAAKYLDNVFKDSSVKEHLSTINVTWQCNVERAPWWGGAFERMIRSTKRCLKKAIGRAHLSLNEITTVLAEIETVLNSQPLTYVSGDDMEEPVTPSHLVVGRQLLSLPDDFDYILEENDEE